MQSFKVELLAGKRLLVILNEEAKTPKEAAFKAMDKLTWRRRKILTDCKVIDESGKVWNY